MQTCGIRRWQRRGLTGALLALWAAAAAGAEPALRVVFGMARPPFVDDQRQSGISVELFREAARRAGHRFDSQFAPNRRMVSLLEEGQVDVAVEVPADNTSLHYSAPFVSYRNVVAWKAPTELRFAGWEDLARHAVCTWQLADQTLGPAFAAARKRFGLYQEFGSQRDQVRLWLMGRCEVLVIDQTLLRWHLKALSVNEPDLGQPEPGNIHQVPVPGSRDLHWYLGFRDAALRDRFDAALRSMREDGRYDTLVNQQLNLR